MQPSHRQQRIYDCWQNEDSNILVSAVAGSGKTTMLLRILEMCQYRVLFLAFNKSIQTEIEGHIEANNIAQGKALTLHALGLKAIRNRYKKIRINNGKNFDIIKEVQYNNQHIFRNMRWEDKLKLSYTLMDMNDVSRIYLTKDLNEIKGHMISMDKNFFDFDDIRIVWDEFLSVREKYYDMNTIQIDFLDMIYFPVVKELFIPVRPTYLCIDESQDLNFVQHKMIDNLLAQGDVEKWIAVGDPYQSIYGFAGSYSSSFDKFKEKENVLTLPLDICYRCPVDVIGKANEVYDIMQGHKQHTGTVGVIKDIQLIKDDSMIVCRNSAPIIDIYFKLIAQGKKVFVQGDDILGKLKSFLKPYNKKTTEYVFNKLGNTLRRLKDKTDDSSRFEFYKTQENYDNLVALVTGDGTKMNDTVENMMRRIEEIFSGEEEGITLCTIHKSKGLEANVVYILKEELIPSKFARSDQQLKQEQNLKYVARTRAKEELYFLNI